MSPLRDLVQIHSRLTLVLLGLALAVKALVPTGFMPALTDERVLTVTICADATGMARQMRIAIPDKDQAPGDHSKATDTAQPCAFSGLGSAMTGGADPVLLASAAAFILLLRFAAPASLPLPEIAFLRPPLRGPPLLNF